MGHYFKYLGSKESMSALWQNREALDKYLKCLRSLMAADGDQSAIDEIASDPSDPEYLLYCKFISGERHASER